MVAAGNSLAPAVGAEEVSVEGCPVGDAPVGITVKSSPLAKTLKRAAENHGDSHARQDAVATRAVHTAQASTSNPATSRIKPSPAL